ncbi:hypothetical protein RMATCC62417_11918 [Rhizopus microsporus]|nr:hypothetical protein RMATCC62417_11918 [Rhizopus microsporus]
MQINSKVKIRKFIHNLFTKKYGLVVQSDAAKYLEQLLAREPDIADTIERIVKTYKKRYNDEQTLIINRAVLEEVNALMQTSALMTTATTPFQRADEEEINESLRDMSLGDGSSMILSPSVSSSQITQTSQETVDVAQHFHVVGAFDMPKLIYDEYTRTFRKSREPCRLLSDPKSKGEMFRERLLLTKQRVLRNEMFCPTDMAGDSSSFIKITPIKSLIGHDGGEFVLFGMLTQIEEGKLYLEDDDAHIELDISKTKYEYGLFTDGIFVLAEGIYGEDHVFHVTEISLPPAEARNLTDVLLSHVDFLGLPRPLIDESILKEEEQANKDIFFVIISDLHLDQPKVMNALRTIFEGYSNQVPLAFIFIGNFSSKPFTYSAAEATEYKDNFNALADLISEFETLATHSNFVFVPGARDPWGGNVLPQRGLPSHFVTRIRQKVKKAHFTTNPCRVRYCTQDIVIFREDLLNKIWRNTLIPTNLNADNQRIKHLVRTILDQGHLCPLPLSVKPVYWGYDHALRLFPLPHAIILADKCENYGISYEETHCINPGSFPNSEMTWSVYFPATKTSQKCSLSGR